MSTRREFLRRATAAASLALLPGARAWSATDAADVIVLGAGLAGLTAARELERQGARTLVLEAQQRVGGRVYTFAANGAPEAGGLAIYGDYRRLVRLAESLGLALEDQVPRMSRHAAYTLVLDGKPVRKEDWPSHPRNPFPYKLREMMPWQYVPTLTSQENPLRGIEGWYAPDKAPLDVSLREFLRAQGATDPIVDLAWDTIPTYGLDAEDVSALMMAYVSAFTLAQKNVKPALYQVVGGNQRLPEAMAAGLGEQIRRGEPVKSVAVEAQRVVVRTAGGDRYEAKACVCALPFSALRDVDLEPALTGAQARAVRTLPYQPVHQVVLHVSRPFWQEDGLEPSMWTDSRLGRVAAVYRGSDEVASLLVSTFGRQALQLDRMGRDDAVRHIVSEFERARPAARGALEVAAQHSWSRDPYAGGAWAYYRPGTVTKFLPAMLEPAGRLHFCGEHTSVVARGMEGAIESGERAAQAVLAQLG